MFYLIQTWMTRLILEISLSLLYFFLFSHPSICSTMAFLHQEILIMLSWFPGTVHQTRNGIPHFIALIIIILVLIVMVFMIILEMFHGRISVLLLLLVSFVGGFRLELMHISLILISCQASLTSMVFSCLCCCHSL